jgi:hypothetical protein
VFEPGPGEEEAALARLVVWVTEQPGLLGAITAWTEVDGQRTLIVGVVIEGDVDRSTVHTGVAAVLGDLPMAYLIESFDPSRGLPPLHLRLYRSSTRLWSRPVERAPTAQSGVLQLDTGYHKLDQQVDQVIDVSTSIDDEEPTEGFTLVGLDLNASVQQGADTADERDAAVAAWVGEQPHALAVLRATVSAAQEAEFPVYSVLVDAEADRAELRVGVARVVAGTGLDRCGVEIFCPFDQIAVFHVQLYGASLSLWKADHRPSAGPDAPAATEASGDPAGDPS